jgi:hypothetical protein
MTAFVCAFSAVESAPTAHSDIQFSFEEIFVALKRADFSEILRHGRSSDGLTTEAVQGASLALERIDDVHGRHGLALGVLGVGDGIADDVLEEDLEDATGLLVDQTRDALDTASASQTTDCRLGDALDVVTQHLAMALGAPLSESLASFTATRHDFRASCLSSDE